MLLTGEAGVGKSRLTALVADEARHAGWTVGVGRAYPVESGVPYAVVSDAIVPLLRELGASGLTVLARGNEGALVHLFPGLRTSASQFAAADPAPSGNRAELFWTFAELLKTLAARAPLLLVLEDLHWADSSSLELLHFVARQLGAEPLVIVGTVNDSERDAHPTLRATLKSLESLAAVEVHPIGPLSRDGTAELVRHAFNVAEPVARDFAALLYGWTRGNPFFIEETLKTLLESGRLRQQEGVGWVGWEVAELDLPRSVRDAVELRLARLGPAVREVGELIAVIGTRASFSLVRALSTLDDETLVDALEQLRLHNVLAEEGSARDPVYDFRHPMLREAFHAQAGLARRRMLHARIAETLEARYSERAIEEHAGELARHFVRGESAELSERAAKYLTAAGSAALARFADREAAQYLEAALERVAADGGEPRETVMQELARARQRLGDFEGAIELRRELYATQRARGDRALAADTMRRIALAYFWDGRPEQAIDAYDTALADATAAGDLAGTANVRLGRGALFQGIGRVQDSLADLRAALDAAERAHEPTLAARAHRELLLCHTMAGPPDQARHHGARAIALATASDDHLLAATCHWAMSVLEGLTGHADECARHMQQATELAEELNSPLLRLAIDEVHVEWAYGLGVWDVGVAIGERAIALARSLHQRQLLPRLLVWTAILHLGRNQIERAKAYVDEAWELSGAGDANRALDVHTVVPAHIGRAHYHMTLWQWDEAIRVGRAGLEIVDRAGYQTWAVHRLLPIIAEAQLYSFDVEGARETGRRLRRGAEAVGSVLGLAWADACDAVVAFREQGSAAAAPLMREAVRRLEAVPYIPGAARLRRQLAGRLADIGDREGAVSELRRAHDTFVKLGAQWELEKTRVQFQELDARPPGRGAGQGVEALTERELEIVRLIASGKSNKAIGKALDISPRTVSTHLSNVYAKLEIGSREELAELAATILSV